MNIITGIGRSGTSFIATVFKNLGYQMGSWSQKVNAGYENPQIVSINNQILGGAFKNSPSWREQLCREAEQNFIVKDPRFMFTLGHWLNAGAGIKSVIWCVRPERQVLASSLKSSAGLMAIFNHLDLSGQGRIFRAAHYCFKKTVRHHRIPLAIIRFPQSIQHYSEVQKIMNLGVIKDENKLKVAWYKALKAKNTG